MKNRIHVITVGQDDIYAVITEGNKIVYVEDEKENYTAVFNLQPTGVLNQISSNYPEGRYFEMMFNLKNNIETILEELNYANNI